MKKLLLSTLLVAGAMMPMAAQDLYFEYNGEKLTNGQTLVITESPVLKPYGSEQTKLIFEPKINLVVVEDALFSIQGTSEEFPIQLCIGTDCRQGNNILKEEIENNWVNEPQDLLFECVLTEDNADVYEIPVIEALIEVWYSETPEEVVTLNVQMGGMSVNAGVESIGAALNSVKVNGRELIYDVNGTSQLSLYSLSGKTVINKTVAGNGAISLEGLAKGVYLYRLTNNGKSVKSAKIIVR